MSLKVVAIPIVAAGVGLAMFKLVSLKRTPSSTLSESSPRQAARPRLSAPVQSAPPAAPPLASTAKELSERPAAAGPTSTTVLPIAFWDAASEQLEDEEAPPTPRINPAFDAYDSIAPEDLGVEWLSRATEAFEHHASPDAPNEVQADSSMMGEASRFAAASPSDAPESQRLDEAFDETDPDWPPPDDEAQRG